MKINKTFLVLASAALLCAGNVAANPVLRLSTSQGLSQTVADGDPLDVNPIVGGITFVGPLGAWILNVTTGVGSAVLGGPHLDLNSVNVSSFGTGGFPAGGGSITLELTEQNLTLGSAAQLVNFAGLIGGTLAAGGNISFAMYVDDGNALFGLSQLIGMGSANSPGGASSAFSDSFSSLRPVTDTFSMTLRVVITHPDGQRSTSFDFEGTVIPEPATLLLIGVGMLALALYRRRSA